jgi:hypothetical protein
MPDGETGPRRAWVGYERERLCRNHPDLEIVRESDSPSGIPRHAYETPVFRVRDGVRNLKWNSWPRIDDAIASYQTFRTLQEQGVIPAKMRFQVGLPFPSSAMNAFKVRFADDYVVVGAAYEELVLHELKRLTEAIPPSALAIQWDVCYETLDIEGVIAWMGDGAWERFIGPVSRLTRVLPQEVLVGYHFCYGTFPDWPMYEARDMSRYMTGLLIFLGLLGTFWGLIETVGSVGKVIEGLKVGGDAAAMFDSLKEGLAAPLGGMGISFSSSLFGLAGSLVLGFLDLQTSQAQNRFYTDLEDWLATTVRDLGAETHASIPGAAAAASSSGAEIRAAIERLREVMADGGPNKAATGAMANLAEAIQGLVHHMRSEQQLIREWVDAQAVQHREIRRLLEILAHAPAHRD